MNALFFCDDMGGTTHLPNLTPSPDTVVRDLDYCPGTGDGQTARDEIHLTLEGRWYEIEAFLSQLERALTRAAREADIPGGDTLYLACRLDAGSETWRSVLRGGWVTLGPGRMEQRTHGSQRCTLTLRRSDWWEKQSGPLLVSMQNALGQNGGQYLEVNNHTDAQHTNLIDLPAQTEVGENITGDLPTPAMLVLDLPYGISAYPVTFFVGESARKDVDQLTPAYPGESGAARDGVTGALVSDAGCAGGQCLSLSWSGAQEQAVWQVDLGSEDGRILAGDPVLPLLRLNAPLPQDSGAWYRWKVYALTALGEILCSQSPLQAATPGCQLLSGPALNLPPWRVDQAYPYATPGLRLVLAVQMAGEGTHALAVDSLSLMGLDGWRIYRPLTGEPSNGIRDDPARGTLYRYQQHSQSHAAEGPGFMLQPGAAHRFTYLALCATPTGQTVPLDLSAWAWIYYRPRKRNL